MAFVLIDGIIELAEVIGEAVEADLAANAASGAADGLANVAWGTIPEGVETIGALGVTVATIGSTMGQTTGTPETVGSGELPRIPNVINDGTRNVVYDPEAAPHVRLVYQPFVDSRGGEQASDGGQPGGRYSGIWFNRRRQKKIKRFL